MIKENTSSLSNAPIVVFKYQTGKTCGVNLVCRRRSLVVIIQVFTILFLKIYELCLRSDDLILKTQTIEDTKEPTVVVLIDVGDLCKA